MDYILQCRIFVLLVVLNVQTIFVVVKVSQPDTRQIHPCASHWYLSRQILVFSTGVTCKCNLYYQHSFSLRLRLSADWPVKLGQRFIFMDWLFSYCFMALFQFHVLYSSEWEGRLTLGLNRHNKNFGEDYCDLCDTHSCGDSEEFLEKKMYCRGSK